MNTTEDIFRLFVSRSDAYAVQKADGSYASIKKPLTEPVIQLHIEGKITIGMYTIGSYDTCIWGCWDIDIASKKEIAKMHEGEIAEKKKDALAKFIVLREKLKSQYKIDSYIEDSGWKGYHLWIFCEPIEASVIRKFMEKVANEARIENIEKFPKQDRRGEFGNLVKLPLGIHQITKARSSFLDPESQGNLSLEEASKMLSDIQPSKIPVEDERKEIPTDTTKKTFEEVLPLLRPCFQKAFTECWVLVGDDGHKFRVAALREFDEKGASIEAIHTFYRVQPDYVYQETEKQIQSTLKKQAHPWKCNTIKSKCKGLPKLKETCGQCKFSGVDENGNNGNGKSYNQASDLIKYTSLPGVELFHDEKKEPYARLLIDGKNMIVPVGGREFRRWLTRSFYTDTGTAPGSDALTSALGVVEAVACYTGKEHELFNRVAFHDGAIWYDLGAGEAVKISAGSWVVVKDTPILFRRQTHQKAHDTEKIKRGGDVKKVLDFVNVQSESERLLFLVYLISCFVPEIPHPIPVLYGDKGSSKTTALKMVKAIVDPSVLAIISFPHNNTELVQKLYHHYLAPFDNIADLSEGQSDALCRACTGEGVSKRALFTNEEDVIFNYKRCVALNGINLVADKPDLLDRAILLRMDRISKEKRKTEDKVWRDFNEVKGEIMGGIFDTLAKATVLKPNIHLDELPRMADFMEWGCAISEALGSGVEMFKGAYLANIQSQNKEAIDASPIGDVIMKFVEDGFLVKKEGVLDVEKENSWKGPASALLARLEECATYYKINIKSKTWPKAGNVLTRKINDIKTNLADEGIIFEVTKDRKGNVLSLCQLQGNTSTTSTPPQSILEEPENCGGIQKTNLHNTSTEKQCGGIDDSCGGMKPNIPPHQEQDAVRACGGIGYSGGISPYTRGDEASHLSQLDKIRHAYNLIFRDYGHAPLSPEGIAQEAEQIKAELGISKDEALLLVKHAIADRDRGV